MKPFATFALAALLPVRDEVLIPGVGVAGYAASNRDPPETGECRSPGSPALGLSSWALSTRSFVDTVHLVRVQFVVGEAPV